MVYESEIDIATVEYASTDLELGEDRPEWVTPDESEMLFVKRHPELYEVE